MLKIVQDMSTYAAGHGIAFNSVQDVKNNPDLMAIVAGHFHV